LIAMPLRVLATACAAVAILLAAAAPAAASFTQEAMFQDDAEIVYPPAPEVARTLDTLQALGVDRIRVSVYWRLVAPGPESSTKPQFNAADPAAYPRDNWRRYDDVVRLAYARGIHVNFNLTGPAPDWGSAGGGGIVFPSAPEFKLFATAVATRYTGTYAPPPDNRNPPPPPPRNPNPLPVDVQFGPQEGAQPAQVPGPPEPVLPRVSYWEGPNEWNQRQFMLPQYQGGYEASPRIYRAVADGIWQALQETGHGGDVLLVGSTAPKGGGERDTAANMRPLRFLRALYCVDLRLRPLRGRTAERLGCPTRSQVSEFPRQHPVLFRAGGYAHHAYSLLTRPSVRSRNPDDVGISDLHRLDRALRIIFARYRQRRPLPIFDTEFGYQSRPPDPFGFPLHLQAAYINEGEFKEYVNPRVRSAHQFLLKDAPPYSQFPPSSPQYWSSFQTGLMHRDGTIKPAFNAYRMPIFIPAARRFFPGSFRVWGAARPAPNGSRQTVEIQYRPGRRGRWRTIRRVVTRSLRNYVDTRVRLTRSGGVRLRWRNPATGEVLFSRVAGVQVG
jgi:hypothetical protein